MPKEIPHKLVTAPRIKNESFVICASVNSFSFKPEALFNRSVCKSYASDAKFELVKPFTSLYFATHSN